ncbi:MAG: hypothetical protein K8F25_04395 [Fimbriimonadaceae bacterium]|nr:hypothetical protein [Alphaproteobacteria bacterium]
MKSLINPDRRKVLALGLGLGAFAFYFGRMGSGYMLKCHSKLGEADIASLRRIGLTYLKSYPMPKSDDDEHVTSQVSQNISLFDHQDRRRLSQIAQSEFAKEEIVTCDGWVLAKSEAQYCAKLAMKIGSI